MMRLAFSLEQLPQAAEWLLQQAQESSVIALYGGMGAGKTTLIKAACTLLNAADAAASPTFSLINEYRRRDSEELIYHFDFYRLHSTDEVAQLGAEEYFYSGAICFIEWAELAEPLLPPNTARFRLSGAADMRSIEMIAPTDAQN